MQVNNVDSGRISANHATYKVNNTVISEEDVYREIQYHPAETQDQASVLAIESLIIAELFRQRARALGLQTDPQEHFVDQLIEQEVDYPQASEEDCRNYYDQNRKKFNSSPLLEVKHILLACPADDALERSQANETAKAIIAKLKVDPALFAALAKEHSRCPSAELGGQLGQISSGQTVPEFERQLFNCRAGLVESPIESRYGVHVVYIHRREEARQLSYEHVAVKIKAYLNNRVHNKALAQYIETLITAANIEGFEFKTDRQFVH
ncbi:peptidylprolyl isomerase [Teredinibacter haidensis]|uniref:peptidylprolyl isomerase n=1 Tax=Teredinibacter haidensis TaxID=2731755 RepID=UPI000948A5C1|nr:peptidylprolyl isomerase [Teredinibacter haidensis]